MIRRESTVHFLFPFNGGVISLITTKEILTQNVVDNVLELKEA